MEPLQILSSSRANLGRSDYLDGRTSLSRVSVTFWQRVCAFIAHNQPNFDLRARKSSPSVTVSEREAGDEATIFFVRGRETRTGRKWKKVVGIIFRLNSLENMPTSLFPIIPFSSLSPPHPSAKVAYAPRHSLSACDSCLPAEDLMRALSF